MEEKRYTYIDYGTSKNYNVTWIICPESFPKMRIKMLKIDVILPKISQKESYRQFGGS